MEIRSLANLVIESGRTDSMSKHAEAIEAMRPLLPYLKGIVTAPPSTKIAVQLPIGIISEFQRVVSDWDLKHSEPPIRKRIPCRTCRELNYYENLTYDKENEEGRCPACEEHYRIYLEYQLSPEGQAAEAEKKSKGKGGRTPKTEKEKIQDGLRQMAKEVLKLQPQEREDYIRTLGHTMAYMVREIIKKLQQK